MPEENSMTKEERNGLARELIASLELNGYSQRDIAHMIRRNESLISRVKSGKSNVSKYMLKALEAAQKYPDRPGGRFNYNHDKCLYPMGLKIILPTDVPENDVMKLLNKMHPDAIEIEVTGTEAPEKLAFGAISHIIKYCVWRESQDIRSKKS